MLSAITVDKEASVIETEFGILFPLLPSVCTAALSGIFLQKLSENRYQVQTCAFRQQLDTLLLQKPPYNPDKAISTVQMDTETKDWEQSAVESRCLLSDTMCFNKTSSLYPV